MTFHIVWSSFIGGFVACLACLFIILGLFSGVFK